MVWGGGRDYACYALRFLSQDVSSKFVSSLILSRLEYCHSLLAGTSSSSHQTLQRIKNCAVRLVLKKKKPDHITALFRTLHWLPIRSRIIYKLNTLCHKCIINLVPEYLYSWLHLYTPSRTLRSSSDTLTLYFPRTKLPSAGQRAFTSAGPSTWNLLPLTLRQIPTHEPSTFGSQVQRSNLWANRHPHCLSKCVVLCKYIVVFFVVCNCAPWTVLLCDGISAPYK